MTIRTITFLAFLSFITGPMAGIHDALAYPENVTLDLTASDNSVISSDSECQDKGCDDSTRHCIQHCSGKHISLYFAATPSFYIIIIPRNFSHWEALIPYNSPFLEPGLRPPLHT